MLVNLRRHVEAVFELEREEFVEMVELVPATVHRLQEERSQGGFDVGLNTGFAAGQMIAHVHVHVIPRYEGDVEDPRGGVRWVLPDRAPCWEDDR